MSIIYIFLFLLKWSVWYLKIENWIMNLKSGLAVFLNTLLQFLCHFTGSQWSIAAGISSLLHIISMTSLLQVWNSILEHYWAPWRTDAIYQYIMVVGTYGSGLLNLHHTWIAWRVHVLWGRDTSCCPFRKSSLHLLRYILKTPWRSWHSTTTFFL